MADYGFKDKFEKMSPFRQDIVRLVAAGHTNEQIAGQLHAEVRTVRSTISAIGDIILEKLVTGPARRPLLGRLYNEYLEDLDEQLRGDFVIKDGFSGPVWNLLFVYGSLIDQDSLRRSLADPKRRIECIPAFLDNHNIRWGVPSWRPLVDPEGASVNDLYLEWLVVDRTAGKSKTVPGAVINVTDADLQCIRWRERSYAEVDVTEDIRLPEGLSLPENCRVLTFRSPGHDHPAVPVGYRTAVRKGYHDMAAAALAQVHDPGVTLPRPSVPVEDVFAADALSAAAWKGLGSQDIVKWDLKLQEVLRDADCTRLVGGAVGLIPYVLRPLVVTQGVWKQANLVSETAVRLCGKALAVLLDDRQLQRAAGYDDRDVRMAQASLANNFSGRDRRHPHLPEICRADLVLTDRGDLYVLELNCDSPAGGFNLDVLVPAQLEKCRAMGMGYLPEGWPSRVCESALRTLERHWDGYLEATGADRRPMSTAAILDLDVRDRPTSSEFREFQRRFQGAEIEAEILEPDEIAYRDGKLVRREDGIQIDLVYKRLLFDQIVEERNSPIPTERSAGIGALEQAYSDNAVCMAPTMLSRMVGNKILFAIIKHPSFEERLSDLGLELTDDERRVRDNNIPETHIWASGPLPSEPGFHQGVLEDTAPWVIKAVNSYSAQKVHFGSNSNSSNIRLPRSVFLENYNRDYIVQRVVPHGTMEVPVVMGSDVAWQVKPFTLGCYVFRSEQGAQAVGMEAKVTSEPPVALNLPGGGRTAVFPTTH